MAEDIRITGENARSVYYCSRMISAQYGTEFVKSNYQNVRVGLGKPDGENYDGVLKMLGALFSGENIITEKKRILEQDFDIPMTETLERRLSEMCNLSQGFEERGMKRGFEKGRVEGLTEGRIESTISTIRSLMGSMGWTMEQTMDAMQLPTADRPKYAEMLKLQRVRTFTENDIPNGSWQHEILTTSIGDIALVTRKP